MTKTDIKIEPGIPIPETRGTFSKYPFGSMNPGDSFFVACDGTNDERKGIAQRLATAARYGTRSERGWKFSVRKVENGVRCWRVS